MLYWAAVFFIIALVAAVPGFGVHRRQRSRNREILFFIFLIRLHRIAADGRVPPRLKAR